MAAGQALLAMPYQNAVFIYLDRMTFTGLPVLSAVSALSFEL